MGKKIKIDLIVVYLYCNSIETDCIWIRVLLSNHFVHKKGDL